MTVNPDDENSYVVQIYSQEIIDDNTSAKFQEDEEILKRSQSKQQLRIKVPGICAFYFELIIEIIIGEVLCWDLEKQKAMRSKQGLFGKTKAFVLSIEEQARKTLHAHLQIWVKNYHAIREKIYTKKRKHNKYSKYICDSLDNVASCAFFLVINKKFEQLI